MRRTMGGASNRILQVAAERFAENGYRGTSIEDIALGAEISRSSLFWHFGSKEGLLRAVIEDTLSSWVGMIAEAGSEERGLVRIRSALAALTKLHDEHPSMVRLLSLLLGEASATETSLAPIFIEIEQSMLGFWRKCLSEAAEDGELSSGVQPEKVATVLNAATFGMRQLWALEPENHQTSAMEDALLHLIDCVSASGPPAQRANRRRPARAGAGNGTSANRRSSSRKTAAK